MGEVVKLIAAVLSGLLLFGSCSSADRNSSEPLGPAEPAPNTTNFLDLDEESDEEEVTEAAFRIMVVPILPEVLTADSRTVNELADAVCDLADSAATPEMFIISLLLVESGLDDDELATLAGAAMGWKCPEKLDWLEEAL